MFEMLSDNVWLTMHSVMHGNEAFNYEIKDTKRILKDLHERHEAGTLDYTTVNKGVIDCLVYYSKYKEYLNA